MPGERLGALERAAIEQVCGDARGPAGSTVSKNVNCSNSAWRGRQSGMLEYYES